jgi:transketolase
MKKLWQRKWLVLALTVAVFLSIGAVAWATTSGGQAGDSTPALPAGQPGLTAAAAAGEEECDGDCTGNVEAECDGDCAESARPGSALRKAFREKAEQWAQRHEKLMQALRDGMTPADQALYDQLVQKAKEQREALQEARNDLMQTLEQLRDLADKYLDDES